MGAVRDGDATMASIDFSPLLHTIKGPMHGYTFKTHPYAPGTALEPSPRRSYYNGISAAQTAARNNYRYADQIWQTQPESWRALWGHALKKPGMCRYGLWMQEALYWLSRCQYAPDVPGPSGGYRPELSTPGTTWPDLCEEGPPEPVPPEWGLIEFHVMIILPISRKIYWLRNPETPPENYIGSWLTIQYGTDPEADPVIFPYIGWVQLQFNPFVDAWCNPMTWPPTCYPGDETQQFDHDFSHPDKGGFAIDGPNLNYQQGYFTPEDPWIWQA